MKRNAAARELASGKYRQRVVRSRKAYTRKVKHKNKEGAQ
jgi:stalled ribosome alternative rescue factor ArfA